MSATDPTGADRVLISALRWTLVGLGAAAAGVTALSATRSPRWPVRIWDFPRVQIAAVSAASAVAYAALGFRRTAFDWSFLAMSAACTGWQIYRIYPYTRLAPKQVEQSCNGRAGRTTFRLLISNVLMENTRHDLLLGVVREADPDLILLVETDAKWGWALEQLATAYPHAVRQPQDNYYGMMLLSRFPLIEPCVEFLVQDDVPSVHAAFDLPGGGRVYLHGLHPRPPEPVRAQDATPRDAELVIVGRSIGEAESVPTVVAGDLNDVAWSRSSRLFLRLSGLLDPRIGRGFYNSYNAKNVLFRYPLDHVFHSNHFRLVDLRRLPAVGSDHFPMLVELSYEPTATASQPETPTRRGDRREAEQKLEEQAEAAQTGADRPGRGGRDDG